MSMLSCESGSPSQSIRHTAHAGDISHSREVNDATSRYVQIQLPEWSM